MINALNTLSATSEAKRFTCGNLSEYTLGEIVTKVAHNQTSLEALHAFLIATTAKRIAKREALMFQVGRECFFKATGKPGVDRRLVPANKTGKSVESRSFMLAPAKDGKPEIWHSPKWQDKKSPSSEVQLSTLEEMESAIRCAIIAYVYAENSPRVINEMAIRLGHRAARMAITRIMDKRITPTSSLADEESELASEEPQLMQAIHAKRFESEKIRCESLEHFRRKCLKRVSIFWDSQPSQRAAIAKSKAMALVNLIFDKALSHDEDWKRSFLHTAKGGMQLKRLKEQIAKGAQILASQR